MGEVTGTTRAGRCRLGSLTADAIGGWRLQDATFRQRVKFRSGKLRAIAESARRQGE